MANHEESSPLLTKEHEVFDEKNSTKLNPTTISLPAAPAAVVGGATYGWTADGLLALSQGSVVGEPLGRTPWESSLFACLSRNDEFCSSDLKVYGELWRKQRKTASFEFASNNISVEMTKCKI